MTINFQNPILDGDIRKARPLQNCVALGDSRVYQIHTDANFRYVSAANPFGWGNALSGHRLTLIANLGVANDRTDQIMARLPQVLEANAGTLYLLGGINDISTGYPSTTTSGATAFDNLRTIVETVLSAGYRRVIWALDTGSTTLGSAAIGQLVELNNKIREYAEVTEGVVLFDMWPAIALAGNNRTAIAYIADSMRDGTHFGNLAGFLGGKVLSSLLTSLYPPRALLVDNVIESPGSAGDTNSFCNIITNPLFSTTTGGTAGTGVSGSVPGNGWDVSRLTGTPTCAVSTGDPSDGSPGKELILAITSNADGDVIHLNKTLNTTYWAIADVLTGRAEIVVDAGSVNLQGVFLDLTAVTDTSTTTSVRSLMPYTATSPIGTAETYKATLITEKLTVPGSVKNSLAYSIRAAFGGAGSATVRIRRASVMKRFLG